MSLHSRSCWWPSFPICLIWPISQAWPCSLSGVPAQLADNKFSILFWSSSVPNCPRLGISTTIMSSCIRGYLFRWIGVSSKSVSSVPVIIVDKHPGALLFLWRSKLPVLIHLIRLGPCVSRGIQVVISMGEIGLPSLGRFLWGLETFHPVFCPPC